MNLRAKILLLWLLTLTIPVQGFAAAVQMDCTSWRQVPAAHEVIAFAGSAHEHSHTGHDMQMHFDTDDGDHGISHQHKKSCSSYSACSACNSCNVCTIGAIIPATLDNMLALPAPADIHVATPQHGYVGYLPDNPERPPSPLL